MKTKKWVKVWIMSVVILIPIVGSFNYIIDPYGYNNQFKYSFNKIKNRKDERIEKFNLINKGNYNSYIFGSSRNTIMDPKRIDKYLLDSKTINSAFSSASIDEIEMYINFIIKNKQSVKYIFIPIDLFAFDGCYKSNGTLPTQLVNNTGINKNMEYFTIKILGDSLLTLYLNLTLTKDKDIKIKYYKDKGMRYYKDYLQLDINSEAFTIYIKRNVTIPKAHWHSKDFSKNKVHILNDLYMKLVKRNVKVYIYTNPITYQQILKDDSFLIQLNLLDEILNNTKITIYDFNNINNINMNNSNFLDSFHFNYTVADCIVDKILIGKSKCGNDFGKTINSLNIKEYKRKIKERYKALKSKFSK